MEITPLPFRSRVEDYHKQAEALLDAWRAADQRCEWLGVVAEHRAPRGFRGVLEIADDLKGAGGRGPIFQL